jgi:hypothetical protein
MQIQTPALPPIIVNVLSPEKHFYQEWDFWVSVGTMALAIATIWLAMETRRMRRGSDKAMGELAKHAEHAANASIEQAKETGAALDVAKRNADASERLAEANEALAISGQRGWFIVKEQAGSVTPVQMQDGPRMQIHLSIRFVNAGKTPVANVRIRACSQILQSRPLDYSEGCNNQHHPIVAPGTDIGIGQAIMCTHEEHRALTPAVRTAYFYGNVSYQDVFGYSRSTYWCYMYDHGNFIPTDSNNKFD